MLASTLDEIIANCCSDSIVCVSVRFRYSGRICIALIANTEKMGSIPILGVSVVQVHISDLQRNSPTGRKAKPHCLSVVFNYAEYVSWAYINNIKRRYLLWQRK